MSGASLQTKTKTHTHHAIITISVWKSRFHIDLLWASPVSSLFFKTSVCQNQVVNDFLMPDDNWSKKKKKETTTTTERKLVSKCHDDHFSPQCASDTLRRGTAHVSQCTCDVYAFDTTCWMFHFFYLGVGLYCWFLISFFGFQLPKVFEGLFINSFDASRHTYIL